MIQPRSRAEMREAVLTTALELGSQMGEEGLTMRAISARLGVSATAIYQHFENKAAILREVRLYGHEVLHRKLEPSFALKDPEQSVVGVWRAYVEFARENPWLYTVLMHNEQIDWVSLTADEISRSMVSMHAMQKIIRDGKEQGIFCQSIPAEILTLQLWATMHGLAQLIIDGRFQENHPVFRVPSLPDFIDGVFQITLRGLRA